MIYCINPECKSRQNPDNLEYCQTCATSLLIDNRYRLIKPLRQLNLRNYTDIFEVEDGESRKVMKVLKDSSPHLIEMFEREVSVLQWLNYPGIPKVEIDGYFTFMPNNSSQELHCLVMEKIEGENLEEWLEKNGKITNKILVLKWLKQLIEIIDILHQNHIFHRDIKPSNIMLRSDGQLVLIDFGSVRPITETYLAKIKGGLNVTSILSGGYTAPEQINNKAIPQSDFYALGRTFVHLLTGKSPIELPIDKKGKLIWQNKLSHIPKPLADFIDELMAFSPADRPQNTTVILRYLTPKGLLIKSIWRIIDSRPFRLGIALLLVFGIVYRLSFPLQAQYYSSIGRKALIDEKFDIASKNYEIAIELNPNDARFRSDLGLICKKQRKFDCAVSQYQQALKLNSDEETVATIHYNLGVLYEDIGELDKALKEYKIAMQDRREIGINATNNLARLQIWHYYRNTEAISLITKVLNQTQTSRLQSTLYKNLGWAYFEEGNYREAEKYLRKAIYLDKDNRAAPHCLLAKVMQESKITDVLSPSQKCRDYNDENLPEVEAWQLDARRYLKTKGKKL